MGVRVAYGERKRIASAISQGVIPKGSIIITKDKDDTEMLFYDTDGVLKTVSERTRFKTMAEAQQWVKTYPCVGFIFAIYNGSEWLPYIVNDDNSLSPIKGESIDVTNIKIIDGGTAEGLISN